MGRLYDPYEYPDGDGVPAGLSEAIARAPEDKQTSIHGKFGRMVRHIVPAQNVETGKVEDVDLSEVEITKDAREGFYRLINKAGEPKVTTGALILGALALGGAVFWKHHKNQHQEK